VWICASPNGYLQATGRDARGRKQYRYHADWRAFRDQVKFDRLGAFGLALPDVRRTVATDLTPRKLTREQVLATVVRLLETTLVRVGNEEYARANDSYGLTTLRNVHVKGSASRLRLVFKGKSGKAHEVGIDDPRVARVVRACKDLPGQHLFEYRDDDDVLQVVQSNDVNDYLRDATGIDVTAKDFRTWAGTTMAAAMLADLPVPETDREAAHGLAEMAREVSGVLRNTPAVCRASYVHPRVIGLYEDGTLPRRWARASARGPRGLVADERRLLALLGGRRRSSAARTESRPGRAA
jgi:DNA topoisomerase IB